MKRSCDAARPKTVRQSQRPAPPRPNRKKKTKGVFVEEKKKGTNCEARQTPGQGRPTAGGGGSSKTRRKKTTFRDIAVFSTPPELYREEISGLGPLTTPPALPQKEVTVGLSCKWQWEGGKKPNEEKPSGDASNPRILDSKQASMSRPPPKGLGVPICSGRSEGE